MSYCPRCGYKHDQPVGADWQCVGDSAAEIAALKAQLPEGMKHCTIRAKSCAVGHGRLTADNWVDIDCPHCENARLREELDKMQQAPK